MKPLINLIKKDIDVILCTQYVTGYSEYDYQYKELVTRLAKQFSDIKAKYITIEDLYPMLGEFNVITKKIYEDVIIYLYKIKFKRYPLMEQVYDILNNNELT